MTLKDIKILGITAFVFAWAFLVFNSPWLALPCLLISGGCFLWWLIVENDDDDHGPPRYA